MVSKLAPSCRRYSYMGHRVMRKIPCPIDGLDEKDSNGNPVYWVGLPDRWLAKHAEMHDVAAQQASATVEGSTLITFTVCMCILEDHNLPNLQGDPENWDVPNLDLRLVGWINSVVYTDYNASFLIKKN